MSAPIVETANEEVLRATGFRIAVPRALTLDEKTRLTCFHRLVCRYEYAPRWFTTRYLWITQNPELFELWHSRAIEIHDANLTDDTKLAGYRSLLFELADLVSLEEWKAGPSPEVEASAGVIVEAARGFFLGEPRPMTDAETAIYRELARLQFRQDAQDIGFAYARIARYSRHFETWHSRAADIHHAPGGDTEKVAAYRGLVAEIMDNIGFDDRDTDAEPSIYS